MNALDVKLLRLSSEGLTMRESAVEVRYSYHTVKYRRSKIIESLGVRSWEQALLVAYADGLFDLDTPNVSARQTEWERLDEAETILFDKWLAGRIGDIEYVTLWRRIDAEFDALLPDAVLEKRLAA